MKLAFHLLLVLTGLFAIVQAPARAAESYDSCVGIVAALPAVISTSGTWCLDKDLSTAIASGRALEITANNVTLDCNGSKLGGLAAGIGTLAYGVYAHGYQNITVRNCNIRGFVYGVYLFGAGHVVEDNRFNNNTYRGIGVFGDHSVVRNNQVTDTGGRPSNSAIGIEASADVIDNLVDGVFGDPELANSSSTGISIYAGTGHVVRGNNIGNLVSKGAGVPRGIRNEQAAATVVSGNNISRGGFSAVGFGVVDEAAESVFCTDNTIYNFATPLSGCEASAGNLSLP